MLKYILAMGLMVSPVMASELQLEITGQANGTVTIDLFDDVAPNHVARIKELANSGAYNGVAFHRVIEGFMAQTGDVKYGHADSADLSRAGTGGSDMPDLKAEFSDKPFVRGTVGMARSASPDSANSQFFIMFGTASHLNGQYTVVGQVTDGMNVVQKIRRGRGNNGAVTDKPDYIKSAKVIN